MIVAWVPAPFRPPGLAGAASLWRPTQPLAVGPPEALIIGAVVACAILAYLFILARRDPVTADNVVEAVGAAPSRRPTSAAPGAGAA